jgi:GNAT superfamily N-acetyltransferase
MMMARPIRGTEPEFISLEGQRPGILGRLLGSSYRELLAAEPRWQAEQAYWDAYDREAFENPTTVGACLFLTHGQGCIVGFASWDPRPGPGHGVVGHNCILPEFRGQGLGKAQVLEVLRRFQALGIRKAKVATCDHPFFVPAQRMYLACGFREVRRAPSPRDPSQIRIEYERILGREPRVDV